MTQSSPSSRLFALLAASLLLASSFALGCSSQDEDYAERMAEEHADDTSDASPATEGAPGDVAGSEVVYATLEGEDGAQVEVTGYLARPADAVPGTPAVLVIHEWWGLNDNIRAMARKLAGEGYVALAVDLYEGQVGATREEAREIMSAAMENSARLDDNVRAAYRYLETEFGAGTIGSVGWCFGGGWSLRTAILHPAELDAAVIFYGRLETDEGLLAPLDVPVLGLFGSEDQGIPVDGVRAFEQAMNDLGKDVEIHVYEGADHAFANPTGNRYQAEAAEQAWAETLDFFATHLQREDG